MEQLGFGPRLFGRMARFDHVVKLRNAYSSHGWLCVAVAAGYYDYQHLVRGFEIFTTKFAQQETRRPSVPLVWSKPEL